MRAQERLQVGPRRGVGNVPLGLQARQRETGAHRVTSHDSGHLVGAHEFDAFEASQAAGVHVAQGRPHHGRAQDRAVAKPGHREVRDEAARTRDRANHPFGHVGPSRGSPLAGRDDVGLAGDDLQPAFAGGDGQRRAREGRHLGQGAAGVGHRATPERAHVVRAEIGVTHREANAAQGNPQPLSDEEPQRGAVVLADVNLAGERGHRSVARDVQPGATAGGPRARRDRGRGQHDHEAITQDVEPLAPLGLGHVPRPSGPQSRRRGLGDRLAVPRGVAGYLVARARARVRLHLDGAMHRPTDLRVAAAPADVSLQRLIDGGGVRVGLTL